MKDITKNREIGSFLGNLENERVLKGGVDNLLFVKLKKEFDEGKEIDEKQIQKLKDKISSSQKTYVNLPDSQIESNKNQNKENISFSQDEEHLEGKILSSQKTYVNLPDSQIEFSKNKLEESQTLISKNPVDLFFNLDNLKDINFNINTLSNNKILELSSKLKMKPEQIINLINSIKVEKNTDIGLTKFNDVLKAAREFDLAKYIQFLQKNSNNYIPKSLDLAQKQNLYLELEKNLKETKLEVYQDIQSSISIKFPEDIQSITDEVFFNLNNDDFDVKKLTAQEQLEINILNSLEILTSEQEGRKLELQPSLFHSINSNLALGFLEQSKTPISIRSNNQSQIKAINNLTLFFLLNPQINLKELNILIPLNIEEDKEFKLENIQEEERLENLKKEEERIEEERIEEERIEEERKEKEEKEEEDKKLKLENIQEKTKLEALEKEEERLESVEENEEVPAISKEEEERLESVEENEEVPAISKEEEKNIPDNSLVFGVSGKEALSQFSAIVCHDIEVFTKNGQSGFFYKIKPSDEISKVLSDHIPSISNLDDNQKNFVSVKLITQMEKDPSRYGLEANDLNFIPPGQEVNLLEVVKSLDEIDLSNIPEKNTLKAEINNEGLNLADINPPVEIKVKKINLNKEFDKNFELALNDAINDSQNILTLDLFIMSKNEKGKSKIDLNFLNSNLQKNQLSIGVKRRLFKTNSLIFSLDKNELFSYVVQNKNYKSLIDYLIKMKDIHEEKFKTGQEITANDFINATNTEVLTK